MKKVIFTTSLILTLSVSFLLFLLLEEKEEETKQLYTDYEGYLKYVESIGAVPLTNKEFNLIKSGQSVEITSNVENHSTDLSSEKVINGKDGKDGKDGINGLDGKDGKNGVDGKDGIDGKDGRDGIDGKDGRNGLDGADGKDGRGIKNITINEQGHLIITFTDNETINCGLVKGLNGVDGKDGKDGRNGTNGVDGANGKNGDKGDKGDQGLQGDRGEKGEQGVGIKEIVLSNSTDNESLYKIILTNGDEFYFTVRNGANGSNGINGENGKSAYELALENGFMGTEEEWLASIKGSNGINGKSAYEIAVDNGFVGSEQEWLDSLKGQDATIVAVNNEIDSSIDSNATSGLHFVLGATANDKYDVVGIGMAESKDIVISSTYKGKKINAIYYDAFFGNLYLESVVINNGVKKICAGAFSSCYALKQITIPSSVISVDIDAFTDCENLEEINYITEDNRTITYTSIDEFLEENSFI